MDNCPFMLVLWQQVVFMEKRPKTAKRREPDRRAEMPRPQLKRIGKLKEVTQGQGGSRFDGASGMSKP